MKCPHCGAAIQDDARFCLYCMEPLEEKTQLTPLKTRKRKWLSVALPAVLISVVVIVLLCTWKLPKEEGSDPLMQTLTEPTQATTQATQEATESMQTTQSTETTTEPERVFLPITDYFAFVSNAAQVSKEQDCEDLWQPLYLFMDHQSEELESYVVGVNLPDVYFRIYFVDGGISILTSITGLTEGNFSDGVKLANCVTSAIYHDIAESKVYLDECNMYPAQVVKEGESCLERVNTDYTAEGDVISQTSTMIEVPVKEYWRKQGFEELYVIYELRTRQCDGVIYYDIFMYHGQE